MRYIGIFQIMEPMNLLKPDLKTSVAFDPLGIFYAVFTVVLRRISSIFIYIVVSKCIFLAGSLVADSVWFYYTVIHQNDADGMANSLNHDRRADGSGYTLFVQTCLSECLGSLW